MEENAAVVLLKWVHLLATAAWVGGIITNFLVYLPAVQKSLDPASSGRLMGTVMKRFRSLVYLSMFLLLLTGIGLGWIKANAGAATAENDAWVILVLLKAALFVVMAFLALYAFEFLAPRVASLAAKGPSPGLMKKQRTQVRLALTGLILGLIILVLSAAL